MLPNSPHSILILFFHVIIHLMIKRELSIWYFTGTTQVVEVSTNISLPHEICSNFLL